MKYDLVFEGGGAKGMVGWPQITLDNPQNRASVGKLCDMVDAEIVCVGHGDAVAQGGAQVLKDLVAGKETHPELAGPAGRDK